jgi:hypothetical protein
VFPGGAALRHDGTGWVLVDQHPAHSLGGVLAWATQRELSHVHVVSEEAAGVLARRAACFARSVEVWQVDGADLQPAAPARLVGATPSERALDLVGALGQAGLDIVIEHGEIRGEVLGLEVARVVVDEQDARIEVGVGRHDREAFALVHGDVPTADALAAVVDQVRAARRPGDLTHPLARLAPERWLRHEVLAAPALVGADRLDPLEPTVPRTDLRDPSPALAVGADPDGTPVVVACSVGVDLDLVPAAADGRLASIPDARLRLVVPVRDAHPVTRRLAAALHAPAEVVTVPDDFRA